MESFDPAGLIVVGTVSKPVGLQGSCAVSCEGETLGSLSVPCAVFLGRSPENVSPRMLVDITEGIKGFSVQFEGIDDRTSAEEIRGQRIFVRQSDLPALSEGRFYHFELVGMSVKDSRGESLGFVGEVTTYPTVDVLEVRTTPAATRYSIPMTPDTIKSIDRNAKIIVVNDGSFEITQ